MARMSIDDKFLRDPRVIRLAQRMGWSRRETIGALLDVYAVAYDRERDTLPPIDVDTAAERPGFSDAMFEVDLAEQDRRGVRIKGAKERIRYLDHKSEAGRLGGLKSAETRRNRSKQNRSNPQAPGNPLPLPLVPDLLLLPDPVPEEEKKAPAKRSSADPTPAELAIVRITLDRLSHYSGVRYSGARGHVRLIVGRLRDGYTPGELRAVIAMQAEDWRGDPKMNTYLRPETLFGSQTIERYIDAARTRYADQIAKCDAAIAAHPPEASNGTA